MFFYAWLGYLGDNIYNKEPMLLSSSKEQTQLTVWEVSDLDLEPKMTRGLSKQI